MLTTIALIAVTTVAVAAVVMVLLRWLEGRVPQAWAEPGIAALREARAPALALLLLGGVEAAVRALSLDPELTGSLGLVLLALATIVVAWFVAALSRRFSLLIVARDGGLPNATLIGNLAWVAVIGLGLLIALGTIGVSITPLLTALGVGGLAVALALQPTLTNLVAGVQVLASRQVRPGDYVRLSSGEEGYVTDVTWRQTTIRALANNLVVVPNAQLASTVLTNFHQPTEELSVSVPVGVAYGSVLAEVERLTIEVAREVLHEVPGGVADFEPFVRFHTFGDSAIEFNVIMRAREYVDQYLLIHEFIKRLQARYREAGIVIPFPMRTVTLEPPAASAPSPRAPTAESARADEPSAAPPRYAPRRSRP